MELCKATERKQGAQVETRWQEQAVIDMAGARETEATAEADRGGLEE